MPFSLLENPEEGSEMDEFKNTGLTKNSSLSAELCNGAEVTLDDAFRSLRTSLSAHDFATHQSITLDQVIGAIKKLEDELAARHSSINTGRLRGLLKKLAFYPRAIGDPTCKTPYLPWLWAPILLTLRTCIACPEISGAFLAAYKSIGQVFPDLQPHEGDSLDSDGPGVSPERHDDLEERQRILAFVYYDILEYHRRVYEFLNKQGWETFFPVWWEQFGDRRRRLVSEIATYSDTLQRRIKPQVVGEVSTKRNEWREHLDKQDRKKSETQLDNVRRWLGAAKLDQEDELDELSSRAQEGSCDWIYEDPKLKSWLLPGHEHNILWLKGKPGSGKSVLCASIVQRYRDFNESGVVMLYFICTDNMNTIRQAKSMLQAFIVQIIQRNQEVCSIIQQHISGPSSLAQTRKLLPIILTCLSNIRVVVDGIDGCDVKGQDQFLRELIQLSKCRGLKVLIATQETASIANHLSSRSNLNLDQQRIPMQVAIASLVKARIENIPALRSADIPTQTWVENTLRDKADGMFLWVELVTSTLETAGSLDQIEIILKSVPAELNAIYEKLIEKLKKQNAAPNHDNTLRVFQCLTCAQRTLKHFEIQDAISFGEDSMTINHQSRVHLAVLDRCKPLIESVDDTVRLIHGSVKQYLLHENPFFDLRTAHFNMAISCLAYLSTGVSLFSPRYNERSRVLEIAKGLHGLCRYASSYWVEHLLQFLDLTKNDATDNRRAHILQVAENVASKFMEESREFYRIYKIPPRLDERCELLDKKRPLFVFLSSALEAQSWGRITPRNARNVGQTIVSHPISLITRKYDEVTELLLQKESIEGLDADIHLRFRQTYGTSLYTCRVKRCPRAVHGFSSIAERDIHEQNHVQDFRCSYPQCFGHRSGIGSARKLKEHMEQFHAELSQKIEIATAFDQIRSDTETTLVNPEIEGLDPRFQDKFEISDGSDAEESDESVYDGDWYRRLVRSDRFAIATRSM